MLLIRKLMTLKGIFLLLVWYVILVVSTLVILSLKEEP